MDASDPKPEAVGEALFKEGQRYMREGRYRQAWDTFKEAADKHNNADACFEVACALRYQNLGYHTPLRDGYERDYMDKARDLGHPDACFIDAFDHGPRLQSRFGYDKATPFGRAWIVLERAEAGDDIHQCMARAESIALAAPECHRVQGIVADIYDELRKRSYLDTVSQYDLQRMAHAHRHVAATLGNGLSQHILFEGGIDSWMIPAARNGSKNALHAIVERILVGWPHGDYISSPELTHLMGECFAWMRSMTTNSRNVPKNRLRDAFNRLRKWAPQQPSGGLAFYVGGMTSDIFDFNDECYVIWSNTRVNATRAVVLFMGISKKRRSPIVSVIQRDVVLIIAKLVWGERAANWRVWAPRSEEEVVAVPKRSKKH